MATNIANLYNLQTRSKSNTNRNRHSLYISAATTTIRKRSSIFDFVSRTINHSRTKYNGIQTHIHQG